ncbi:hypothetical protein QYM36_002452 [Artemia franciscana]|uniref:Uncharacterized protein n=1 Tax=Artemia franciscana TaxID=6661 RepID=A0AA88I924_ARTSF|nr:hypothetical protein QYM36_002452 [Artemia franciscana]
MPTGDGLTRYYMLNLLNRELTCDDDVSQAARGMMGALFATMELALLRWIFGKPIGKAKHKRLIHAALQNKLSAGALTVKIMPREIGEYDI